MYLYQYHRSLGYRCTLCSNAKGSMANSEELRALYMLRRELNEDPELATRERNIATYDKTLCVAQIARGDSLSVFLHRAVLGVRRGPFTSTYVLGCADEVLVGGVGNVGARRYTTIPPDRFWLRVRIPMLQDPRGSAAYLNCTATR